jgi:hypothetical protein
MSAAVEEIRRAAALMRERANGTWGQTTPWRVAEGNPSGSVRSERGAEICWSDDAGALEHIASWHPAVALAVADLLERMAANAGPIAASITTGEWIYSENVQAAVALARAYLAGEQP